MAQLQPADEANMTDEPKAPGSAPGATDAPIEFIIGLCDLFFGLGVALANKGLFSREEMADLLDGMLEQQDKQGRTPGRRYVVEHMRDLFRMGLVGERKFTVVDGGRATPPDGGGDPELSVEFVRPAKRSDAPPDDGGGPEAA
jgi:hypothetical protein